MVKDEYYKQLLENIESFFYKFKKQMYRALSK